MSIFEGAGVALVTPFKSDGIIDFRRLKHLVEFQIENGISSIIVCGTTGEGATLNELEHEYVISACCEYANGRVPVIGSTGSNNTKTAINLSKSALKSGVDGLLCITPYYNKTSQDGLRLYYNRIAESVDLPIIMYNVPSRTGLDLETDTIVKIFNENDNIIGIKEASGNLDKIRELRKLVSELAIYSGNDNQIFDMMCLGAKGVISVVANIFPYLTDKIVKSYLSGNVNEAKELQEKMMPLINALFPSGEPNPIAIKYAMEYMNLSSGVLREPLVPLTFENQHILRKEIKKFTKK